MVKCTINGATVEVEAGTSIIEAFRESGQDIAHYCWHPGLSVAGVCRLCMVEIEGNPRLQIACNSQVQEGMVISNQSEMVKDAVKWGLDFHLINHPLDCPICDQAGECGLQNQYMQFGQYDPEMGQSKVKKRKVVDLGERVVLDSERCILCSRCVRFTEEVSKTNELGIFNRGDHSEIGTFADKPLDNNYSVNTVDICPVGALTSKDFRFRQRVWFLENKPSVCSGCSTGCNIDVYYNKEGVWRVKPRHSDVNGYWMCDEGRNIYKSVNLFNTEFVGERGSKKALKTPNRILSGVTWSGGQRVDSSIDSLMGQLFQEIKTLDKKKVALVLTGQYTLEEYRDLLKFWVQEFSGDTVFHWQDEAQNKDEFDGILVRGDKNPNTAGLIKAFEECSVTQKGTSDLMGALSDGQVDFLLVAGPENQWFYSDIEAKVKEFSKAKKFVYMSACYPKLESQESIDVTYLPMKTFPEKSGTFINYEGKSQSFKAMTQLVSSAMNLTEVSQFLLKGQIESESSVGTHSGVTNQFVHQRGSL